ncbi:hypothetical protein D7B24_000888 [Verticillium nonalfalfae]|uniref:Transcriptional regulator n=1 Tax=Verticillium nonalfalfae TaxID=1051616 RepID=A0A3M9Y0V7_9PEZI|nr:uncharacterized protein D7B24_000888 [Verticillium nonalfalfae]RNJ54149.1 hypothetical protein D7B24_000888 [Verticillium nonalfalfae]
MALSKQEIEAAIRDAVREVSGINRDNLTVNYIRKFTEEKLHLEEGFFSEPEWKSRSRALIKEIAESLDTASQQQESSPAKQKTNPTPAPKPVKDAADDDDEEPPKKKKPVARSKARKTAASDEEDGSPPKAKRARKPHKVLDSEPESDDPEGDFGSDGGDDSDDLSQDDSEKEARPTKKRKAGPAPKKPAKKRKTVSDDEDEEASADESSALSDAPPDEDSELSDVMDASPKPKPKPRAKSKTQPKKAAPGKEATPVKPKKQPAKPPSGKDEGDDLAVKSKPDAEDAESSELSDVLDEPPKPKRGAKSRDAAPAKPRAPRKSGAAASDDPDEAEVKKLQSQLVKCGIRKIWGVELRGCGGDPKAKIKHLRGMLRHAGMDGRFSEARAREIKERRELEADLEAVKEMDAAWGVGGRASRSKAKVAMKDASDEGSGAGEEGGNDGSEEDDEDFGVSSKARGRSGAQADLAFLDDDDESGSDDSE